MKEITPYFYKDFSCIGSACKDNCCTAGWEIDIDEKSLDCYKNVTGDFGKELKNGISDGHFELKNGICPFLNENRLCRIILNLGEENLCEICTQHPRFHEWFKNATESGVGLCCEEAGRLLFQSKSPLEFVSEEISTDENDISYSDALFTILSEARTLIKKIAQDRSHPLMKRIILSQMLTERIQDCIDNGQINAAFTLLERYSSPEFQLEICKKLGSLKTKSRGKYISEMLDFYAELEPLNDEWTSALIEMTTLDTQDDSFEKAIKPFEYALEHIFVYTLFRYFLKAIFDGDPSGKLKMAVNSVLLTRLFLQLEHKKTGEVTLSGCISAAKSYSKQIEYDDETEQVISASDLFTAKRLSALL